MLLQVFVQFVLLITQIAAKPSLCRVDQHVRLLILLGAKVHIAFPAAISAQRPPVVQFLMLRHRTSPREQLTAVLALELVVDIMSAFVVPTVTGKLEASAAIEARILMSVRLWLFLMSV